MKILSTPIPGVWVVNTVPFVDERGYLYRGFCNEELKSVLENRTISQVNISKAGINS